MTRKDWVLNTTLGVFFLGLVLLGLWVYLQSSHIRQFKVDSEVRADFEGNDWVSWKNTENGVIADQVHPLPGYKPTDKSRIKQGDRLRSIDYTEITDASVIDKISAGARPGYSYIATVERTDPFSMAVNTVQAFIINGFRLAFSYNTYPFYWQVAGWMNGFGAFAALIILAILFPIVRSNWRDFLALLGVVVAAMLFFLVRLFNHIYLIVESDLDSVRFEKLFIVLYLLLLFTYSICYFYFRSRLKNPLFILPSLLVGAWLFGSACVIMYVDHQMKHYLDLVEASSAIFFLLHLAAGLFMSMIRRPPATVRSLAGLILVALAALAGIVFYSFPFFRMGPGREHVQFIYDLLLFFPLTNATFLQLQFGRVSLVITQTIQYLVAFVVAIVVYLLVIQVFEYIRPNIQYRRILEFITFVLTVALLRLLYLTNEDRFTRYFVSAQREQLNRFKSFIARIPQYTSASLLKEDIKSQLRDFFTAESVEIWQKPEDSEPTQENNEQYEQIFSLLSSQQSVWSRTKEISPFRLDPELEKDMQRSPYMIVCPVNVDQEEPSLLLLGKKRRGVYNLSDLELISQLIQQTQLTLSVLHLVTREKDLIQQTYEANLTALRSQINPHFLFNTLNSIGELVHESADLAEKAVEKLAFIFRYTLRMSNQNFISLNDEMSLVSTYLDLEKIRFGDRLDVHIRMDHDVKDVQMPGFILQTLVENCIKHGIAKILHNGRVSVEAFREDEFLICEVFDNGPGIDLTRIYKSTGLSNSIARVENIYGVKNLLYFENTGNGTLVRLKIPLAGTIRAQQA